MFLFQKNTNLIQFGKVVVPGWTDQECNPEERTLTSVPSQMNSVKATYSKEVKGILSDLANLNKKLEKASDIEKQELEVQIHTLNSRFDEIKTEVKKEIDKIRTRYSLAPDDDQSDTNWGYRV
jgi:hypothetical protein